MRTTLLALSSLVLVACSSDSTDNNPPPGSDITIVSGAATKAAAAYDPNPFTVSLAGQPSVVVTWGNNDGTTHTATNDVVGPFDSGNISPNSTYSFAFTTPGNYPYWCTIHPTMVGTVIVTP